MKAVVAVVTLVMMSFCANAKPTPCFVVPYDVPGEYENARAVFIGEVMKVEEPLTADPGGPPGGNFHRVTLKVEYSWKGAGFREFGLTKLVVLSNQGRDNCFSWTGFSEGKKYLVYAIELSDKNLVVTTGTRTTSLENASGDLEKLRKLEAVFLFPARHNLPKRLLVL